MTPVPFAAVPFVPLAGIVAEKSPACTGNIKCQNTVPLAREGSVPVCCMMDTMSRGTPEAYNMPKEKTAIDR